MVTLVLVALAGFGAQLVDGSLGMAFGATATTGLLAVGTAPAVASASVHLAEIGTSVASGVAHWRMGNVDWPVVRWLAIPGAIGGFLGAVTLAKVSTAAGEPWMAAILILLGCYVLVRFSVGNRPVATKGVAKRDRRWLTPLGMFAGFLDATGGGGWGPVSTSTLLSSGRVTPQRAIGSVDTGEAIVALATSVGFLGTLGTEALSPVVIGGLMIGGVLAAPLSAWLVRVLPTRVIGVGAGGLIVQTNLQVVLDSAGAPGTLRAAVTTALVTAWIAALTWAVLRTVAQRRTEPATADVPDTAPQHTPVD